MNPGEFQFGGIYNNRQLDLASGNGPRTGSMLGWLSAGVDSRIDDWVPVFVPLEAALNFFAVNEFIALELSNTSGAIPAVFPPGLSHYYDGHFTNGGRGYYRQPALVNEQRKFIELGVGATLAFLAYAAELVSTPVSEEDCLCDDPLVRCSGVCRDLNTDNQNCGACGVACFAGTACCNGQCVDVMQNDRNCGRCGRACSVLTNCTNGICACPNPAHAACPDLCTDIKTDPSNCGFCGRRCGQFGTCNDGRCSVPGPD